MLEAKNNDELPEIPPKRYFTIGEVGELCLVKPHVLRYWEAEFPQLKPVKRRGNRRYYQRGDVILIRQIKSLLYEQGYTIGGARLKMNDKSEPISVSAVSDVALKTIINELEAVIATL
ncbi:MerR family transcriptional regulator [Gammaproteobacteria bacterium]|nr:MerR family transcriptional regulator [Gammaproteobacteria bacterium]